MICEHILKQVTEDWVKTLTMDQHGNIWVKSECMRCGKILDGRYSLQGYEYNAD